MADERTETVQLEGATLRDQDLHAVGAVVQVLVDPASLDPRWLQVQTGDGRTVLVPAAAVSEYEPGELLVPYPRRQIEAATVDADGSGAPLDLGADDAARLRRHYGFTN